jgi:hypothetical protein
MQQAHKVFVRMTEVEKIQVRGANDAALDLIGDTKFRADFPDTDFETRSQTMKEIQALCLLESATRSATIDFPRGWGF